MAGETRNTSGTSIGQGESASGPPGIFESYPIASWTVAGLRLAFPVMSLSDQGGNRIIERERPYRDGAKLDDTGSKAKRWAFEVLFENSLDEAGLSENNVALYPDVLNLMVASFDVHETGDLVIPTIGVQRARAESYSRVERADQPDCALVTFNFVEDNEDSVDSRSFTAPTVNANGRRLAEQTTFDLQSIDTWDQTMADLETSLADMEALANSPFDHKQQLEAKATRVQDLTNAVVRNWRQHGRRGRNTMLSTRGNKARRKLGNAQEMSARATNDARRGRPMILSVVVGVDTSLVQIAAMLGQSFVDLLAINPQLENALFIPRGTVVRVFAATGKVP